MKTKFLFYTTLLMMLLATTFTFIACNNDDTTNVNTVNATILYKGADCNDTFLIKFNNNTNNVPTNTTENIFYAINLPNQYKINNLQVNVTFRLPYENEIMNCTTVGITYPQIYIINVLSN